MGRVLLLTMALAPCMPLGIWNNKDAGLADLDDLFSKHYFRNIFQGLEIHPLLPEISGEARIILENSFIRLLHNKKTKIIHFRKLKQYSLWLG